MLCLSSKALYHWTTKQVSLRFTCSIFCELFQNSRTKCPHIQQLLNHKSIKRLRPWFFCVSTFLEIEEYKISVPWAFNKEIKKLRFLPSKMGGRLIHGIDLYTGKYGTNHNVKKKMLCKCFVYSESALTCSYQASSRHPTFNILHLNLTEMWLTPTGRMQPVGYFNWYLCIRENRWVKKEWGRIEALLKIRETP